MIGLLFLGFFAVYFLISFLVVKGTVGWAKKRGRSPWGWGFLSAFLMYNLVFWDWIPTMVLHESYCNNEALRVVYVSPDRWLVQQKLNESDLFLSNVRKQSASMAFKPEGMSIFPLNERIDQVLTETKRWPMIRKFTSQYIDIETKQILAETVDFEAGGCSRNNSVLDYRFWMNRCGCTVPTESTREDIKNIAITYRKMGRM